MIPNHFFFIQYLPKEPDTLSDYAGLMSCLWQVRCLSEGGDRYNHSMWVMINSAWDRLVEQSICESLCCLCGDC